MQRKEYPDGSVYEGVLVDGKQHGWGKFTDHLGDVYEGEWRDGKLGVGKLTEYDGDVYEGEWRDGKKHGRGKYTYANGGVYEGEWRHDKRHGQGKHTYGYGVVYEGAWVDDKRHGEGEYTLANGAVWRGVCDMGTPTLAEMRAAAQLPGAAPVAHGAEEVTPDEMDDASVASGEVRHLHASVFPRGSPRATPHVCDVCTHVSR